MSTRIEVEAALAAWREAERRLAAATDGEADHLALEANHRRSEFQRLSGDHMMERIGALHDAERRRQSSVPSTPAFHLASREEKDIAAEIWDGARESDEDTPKRMD